MERGVILLRRPLCVSLLAMTVGYLVASAWTQRNALAELYLQAAEQKYLIMAGEIGPVTYLVKQSDFDQFVTEALHHDGVLGVEIHEYPDIAAIAFQSADDPAIEALRVHETVIRMTKKFVPMICH